MKIDEVDGFLEGKHEQLISDKTVAVMKVLEGMTLRDAYSVLFVCAGCVKKAWENSVISNPVPSLDSEVPKGLI
jgi:hypothetical protein